MKDQKASMTFSSIALFGLTIAVILIAGFALLRDPLWRAIGGAPDQGPINFQELSPPEKPNSALACRPNYCGTREADIPSPVYDLSPKRLAQIFTERMDERPRVERVDDQTDPLYARYIVRTKWMRFPDTVNIRFLATADGKATLAIFSSSLLGHSDLGKNESRLRNWLQNLDDLPKADD